MNDKIRVYTVSIGEITLTAGNDSITLSLFSEKHKLIFRGIFVSYDESKDLFTIVPPDFLEESVRFHSKEDWQTIKHEIEEQIRQMPWLMNYFRSGND